MALVNTNVRVMGYEDPAFERNINRVTFTCRCGLTLNGLQLAIARQHVWGTGKYCIMYHYTEKKINVSNIIKLLSVFSVLPQQKHDYSDHIQIEAISTHSCRNIWCQPCYSYCCWDTENSTDICEMYTGYDVSFDVSYCIYLWSLLQSKMEKTTREERWWATIEPCNWTKGRSRIERECSLYHNTPKIINFTIGIPKQYMLAQCR